MNKITNGSNEIYIRIVSYIEEIVSFCFELTSHFVEKVLNSTCTEADDIILQMGSYANENFGRVDIRNAIKVLKEVVDLPCYLLRGDSNDSEKVT